MERGWIGSLIYEYLLHDRICTIVRKRHESRRLSAIAAIIYCSRLLRRDCFDACGSNS